MKSILSVLFCFLFSSSLISEGIYGTYSYHIMSLESSRISIFEDGTYQFEFRFMSFKKFISEGVWEYIGDDKYIIKTLYDHNSIPINVVEKSTGSDSLTFVVIGGSWWPPAEELHIDSVIYYLKPKQNVLKLPKSALKVGSVIFYSARKETPDTIRRRISHANIRTVDYRICNPEADLFELSFPVKPPFRGFLDYFSLEAFNDTIVIRNGELFHTDGMTYYLGGKSFRLTEDWTLKEIKYRTLEDGTVVVDYFPELSERKRNRSFRKFFLRRTL